MCLSVHVMDRPWEAFDRARRVLRGRDDLAGGKSADLPSVLLPPRCPRGQRSEPLCELCVTHYTGFCTEPFPPLIRDTYGKASLMTNERAKRSAEARPMSEICVCGHGAAVRVSGGNWDGDAPRAGRYVSPPLVSSHRATRQRANAQRAVALICGQKRHRGGGKLTNNVRRS